VQGILNKMSGIMIWVYIAIIVAIYEVLWFLVHVFIPKSIRDKIRGCFDEISLFCNATSKLLGCLGAIVTLVLGTICFIAAVIDYIIRSMKEGWDMESLWPLLVVVLVVVILFIFLKNKEKKDRQKK
jgi:hypothetical protein